MKSKGNWIVLITAVILIFLFGAWFFEDRNDVEPTAEPRIELADDNNDNEVSTVFAEECDTDKIVGLSISGEELIRLYETIARLEAELAACEGNETKVTEVTKPIAGRSAAKVSKKTAAPAQKTERTSSVTAAPESSYSSNPQIAVNQYVGEIIGDFGVTFDGESKLFFYIKKQLLDEVSDRNISDSYLNGKTGVKGQVIGEYVIYKTDQTVLNNMLDNTWQYAIYIGDHTQYGYDMWLPHELVKLNASLSKNGGIKANDMSGFHFLSKINHKSR